jgi:hypothetical protein
VHEVSSIAGGQGRSIETALDPRAEVFALSTRIVPGTFASAPGCSNAGFDMRIQCPSAGSDLVRQTRGLSRRQAKKCAQPGKRLRRLAEQILVPHDPSVCLYPEIAGTTVINTTSRHGSMPGAHEPVWALRLGRVLLRDCGRTADSSRDKAFRAKIHLVPRPIPKIGNGDVRHGAESPLRSLPVGTPPASQSGSRP